MSLNLITPVFYEKNFFDEKGSLHQEKQIIKGRFIYIINNFTKNKPDIVLLQEIKSTFENFPFFEINAAGYQVKIVGQKAYNGVAVLAKSNICVRRESLPDFELPEARYLEVETNGLIISSVYMPNGNPVGSLNYEKKLAFMDAFYRHTLNLKFESDQIIFGGDFNVIATNNDVYNPSFFERDALFQPEVQQKLKALEHIGFFDAYRALHPKDSGYTYWDYGPSAFTNDFGLRIDYLFCSAAILENLKNCAPDKSLRASDKPSDHTVLMAEFNL